MEQIYIVTGAFGHLGNTIVRELTLKGKKVRGFEIKREGIDIPPGLNVEMIYGDIRQSETIDPLFNDLIDKEIFVIHTAGIVCIEEKFNQDVYNVNVIGTKNMLEKACFYNVKRFIHVSSVHAIPEKPGLITEVDSFSADNVKGLYAKTKAEATQAVLDKAKELDIVVICPSGIIGPNDYGHGHLTQLVIDIGNGKLRGGFGGGYDYVDVRDVAIGIISALENARRGECYILSSEYYKTKQLINTVCEITKCKPITYFFPTWFIKPIAYLAEAWYRMKKRPPLFTKYSIDVLLSNGNFSSSKARSELGYNPRSVKESLTDTVNFLIENKRIKNKA